MESPPPRAPRTKPRSHSAACRRVPRKLRWPSTWRSACSAEGARGREPPRLGPGLDPWPLPLRGHPKASPQSLFGLANCRKSRLSALGSLARHHARPPPHSLKEREFSGGRKLAGEQQVALGSRIKGSGSRIKGSCPGDLRPREKCPFLKSARKLPFLFWSSQPVQLRCRLRGEGGGVGRG